MNKLNILRHLEHSQLDEFECAKQEQREKAEKLEQELLPSLQDYYFLENNNKHLVSFFPVSYNAAIVSEFEALRAQATHKVVHDCTQFSTQLVSLITDYIAEIVPDLALLAVMIRKNQLLLAAYHQPTRQAEGYGCGMRCVLQ
jgi:hypothetical protein